MESVISKTTAGENQSTWTRPLEANQKIETNTSEVEELFIEDIESDLELQPRNQMTLDVVSDYAESMTQGNDFPPITVYEVEGRYYLVDGWHRLEAAKKIDAKTIQAKVINGTREEAVKYAAGSNARHGLRRTDEDKRRGVKMVLELPGYENKSDREIARICKVSHPFVAKVRKSLVETLPPDDEDEAVETLPAEGGENQETDILRPDDDAPEPVSTDTEERAETEPESEEQEPEQEEAESASSVTPENALDIKEGSVLSLMQSVLDILDKIDEHEDFQDLESAQSELASARGIILRLYQVIGGEHEDE